MKSSLTRDTGMALPRRRYSAASARPAKLNRDQALRILWLAAVFTAYLILGAVTLHLMEEREGSVHRRHVSAEWEELSGKLSLKGTTTKVP